MKGLKKLNEKKLLYRVMKKKDPEAYGKLYDFYVEKIFRFVYYKISNREETEDLVSDIFLKAWHYLIGDSNKDVNNFNAFIYRIARNSVIDVYRKRANKQECSLDQIGGQIAVESNFKNIELKQEVDIILKGLSKLKEDYQEIIILKYIEELSTKEIAQVMEKSQANVRVTSHRAIKVLKKVLNESDKN
ncbi:MAG: sigma-70 family RNA polymerase sigma factor [Candidatus Magasanikbacteria bacterium]|nr:sigma-70 family RNA polymerase sigma factor [Candidatus Magasanikbacteria bacterium]